MKYRYKILVWNENYSFGNYDDNVYCKPDKDIDYASEIKVWTVAQGIYELKFEWEKMLKSYEGFTYCVRDRLGDLVIVGGVFDPGDWEIIEEYFSPCE